ncbi:MAG: hypothetical protein ISR84_00350 [Kiritimatiellales bacterium]|nr:hypothetical protein [Kiritimatiellota bacterium]MBL7015986.1 hypothetical protein [Kiritimatiellales bacterium]
MKKRLLIGMMMIAATAVFAEPQTTCPVMKGNKVNPKLYVDADGYRIYVCCGGCKKTIKADPKKYIEQMKAEGVELEKAPETKGDNTSAEKE